MGRTMAGSEKVRAAAMAARKQAPVLVVEGFSNPKHYIYQPDSPQMRKLNIDEQYQRIEEKHLVNDIILALKEGGSIVMEAVIAERPDGSQWIVDGQQRWWAASRAKAPFPVVVYQVPGGEKGLEAEREAFIALNNKKSTGSKNMVKAWSGPSGELIREAAFDSGHPFYKQVNFGERGFSGRFDASIVASGVLMAAAGRKGAGIRSMIHTLTRLDWELEHNVAGRERAVSAMRLFPRCFPKNRVRLLPLVAIASVAYKRWTAMGRATLPPESIIRSLTKYNWEDLGDKHGFSMAVFPAFEAIADKRWPG